MVKVLPRQIQCRNKLESLGLARSGASALTGNFCVESGPSLPSAFRSAGLDHGSQGLPQWRLGRLTAYEAFVASHRPPTRDEKELWPWYGRMDLQLEYVVKELQADYPTLYAKLVKGGDVAALAADVCWQYERPSKALSHITDRINYAVAIAADSTTAAPGTSVPLKPTTIVDHLHKEAENHATQATGGAVVAAGAGLGAIGLALSNFVGSIPTWEWVAFAILAAIVIIGVVGSIQQSHNAVNLKAAAAGVDPVAAPPPDKPVAPITPAPTLDELMFDQAVEAEVQRRMALQTPKPAQEVNQASVANWVDPTEPVSSATGGGPILQVNQAGG